ncbi:MAG: tetratricopeptide repeat protein, partial [Chloroflexota bacterium]
MGFFDKLRDAFGFGPTPPGGAAQTDEMREAMDIARMSRRNEDYDRAMAALDRAMSIADADQDTHSVTVIALHQADILIDQNKLDEAEQLLQTVLQTAEAVNQSGFMSYAMSSMGVLQTQRGDWNDARETFEKAREIGKDVNNPGAEGRAMGHMADVYIHESNASYATHLLQESLPKLNQAGDLELSSYFVGRLGEAMLETGQENEGYQLLDRALRLGEQLRDNRMIRRWSVAIGDVAYNRSNYQEAYMFYKRALPLFAATPDPAYIRTQTQTSRACLNIAQPEEALVYAQQAMTVTQNHEDEALLAMARGALGTALRANNRSGEAVEHLEAAVAVNTAVTPASIELLRQLAAARAEDGDAAAAETAYRQTIEQAEQADLPLAKAEVQRDLGLLHASQRKLADAVTVWSAALATFEAQNDTDQIARLYSDIAGARRQLGQGQRAIRDYEQALIALNHVEDIATRGLVLSNAGNAYADQGDIESAESFLKESIDIARKIGDRQAESTRLGNYGWLLLSTGNPRKGVEKLTQALEISNEMGLKLQAAVQTDNLGLAYDVLNQYRTALEYHQKALAMLDDLENPPLRWQVMFRANAARTRLSLGNVDEAAAAFADLLTQARATTDFEVLAGVLVGHARVLLRQEKAAEAAPF